MKKIAFSLLSFLMLLGGVFLTACDKNISLSVSTQEVVIFTNDKQQQNFQKATVDVTLENSSAGVEVELLSGEGKILIGDIIQKSSTRYSFDINALQSGEAEIRVYARDNYKKFQNVHVTVNTVLEELKNKNEDIQDARSNLFVVRGGEKALNTIDYFDFEPITANINDVMWTFDNTDFATTLQNANGEVVAKIENNKLIVEEHCSFNFIDLRASFVSDTSVSNVVRLQVIENSTIEQLTIDTPDRGELNLYEDGSVTDSRVQTALKRNDAKSSKLIGNLTINTTYDVNLSIRVYQKYLQGKIEELSRGEYNQYFAFNVTEKNVGDLQTNYQFEIDALDNKDNKLGGDFLVFLQIDYVNYNHSVSSGVFDSITQTTTSGVELAINASYTATRIELLNSAGDGLNNGLIDVFSNYQQSNGYKIKTAVLPEDVAIDSSEFYIQIDTNKLTNIVLDGNAPIDSIAYFYYQGSRLEFVQDKNSPNIYRGGIKVDHNSGEITTYLSSGMTIEVESAGNVDVLENVQFDFISKSNPTVANTSLYINFYTISTDQTLEVVQDGDEQPLSKKYISTLSTEKRVNYRVRVNGISTISGLELKFENNSNFKFYPFDLVGSNVGDNAEEKYVVIEFSVEYLADVFDTTKFWFEHVTGKTTQQFEIEAYVPLQTVSVNNEDKASTDVFVDLESLQNYELSVTGEVISLEGLGTSSLRKLVVENGIRLPLNINYNNATLAEDGISFKYLSESRLYEAIKDITGDDEGQAQSILYRFFNEDPEDSGFDINSYYKYFTDIGTDATFTIDENGIYLTNNTSKMFIVVIFNGYREKVDGVNEREEISLLRYFSLESLFSVRYLSSNVRTVELYTLETLSSSEYSRAIVDVEIALRPDDQLPTYRDIAMFSFKSNNTFEDANSDGRFVPNNSKNSTQNQFYSLLNIQTTANGKYLKFRIVANSTNLQTSVNDILTIYYEDGNGNKKETDIHIKIKNENRVESVQWLNQTEDNEIYLNLTTTVASERNFTISTSVLPADANNIGLNYVYFAKQGNPYDLSITTSSTGQTFNLNINTSTGGYGDLYLLPNDMIKTVDGISQFLYYDYVEENGVIIDELACYQPLSSLDEYYDSLINGTDTISNYFLNNDGEKIYYKDIIIKIAITIADGASEGTAIRLYNAVDFNELDYAKYYKVMNNITFDSWTTNTTQTFSGMIFGKDDTITLQFGGSKTVGAFINRLSGTIKDLTFTGNVTNSYSVNAGFVANIVENTGVIENVRVDVRYDGKTYQSSKITSSTNGTDSSPNIFVGGVVGQNLGTLKNVYNYGVSIEQSGKVGGTGGLIYLGGIAGYNSGKLINCGVEFYSFDSGANGKVANKITSSNGIFGGIAGYVDNREGGAIVENCYVYAYPLQEGQTTISSMIDCRSLGAFVGGYNESFVVKQSFAFLGDVQAPIISPSAQSTVNFQNSYITYRSGEIIYSRMFRDVSFTYINGNYSGDVYDSDVFNSNDLPSEDQPDGSNKWQDLLNNLTIDKNIWEIENIDSQLNFGFAHLKNVQQNVAVDVNSVMVANNIDPLKSLSVDEYNGILFVYTPTVTINNAAEISALTSYNTISLAQLFNITENQARTLLVSSDSNDIAISTNSIRVLRKSNGKFILKVSSKMDMSTSKNFKFEIVNYLPELVTTIDSMQLNEGQIVLLQTGLSNARNVNFTTNNFISLNGQIYATEKEDINIGYQCCSCDNLTITKSNNSLVLQGNQATQQENYSKVSSWLGIDGLDDKYNEAIKNIRQRNFEVSVYTGATAIAINGASALIVKPNQYASFEVLLTSNSNDGLVIGMEYDGIELQNIGVSEDLAEFVIDSRLTLQVAITKLKQKNTETKYNVLINIKNDSRYLIENDYDKIKIMISPKSQQNNQDFIRYADIKVKTQDVEDYSIATYNIQNRQIRNSTLYYTPAGETLNSISPASDAIVAVTLFPQFARVSHFTLTYQVEGEAVGLVTLSRLKEDNFGYYVDPSSTTYLNNGIRVDLTQEDKKGDGVFYFRMYVSSAFQANSDLKLILTFYYNNQTLAYSTSNLKVDYMAEANVKVNNVSTLLLPKGSTAEVTIRVGKDQELYNLYLQNSKSGITLSQIVMQEFDTYRLYTATLSVSIQATLEDGASSGTFYVIAQVSRIKNNVQEIKTSQATIYLVNFALDPYSIRVNSSGATTNYNGKDYDVYYAYLNYPGTLPFNYSYNPNEYDYNPNDSAQASAVEGLLQERAEFELQHNYADEDAGYYINYRLNENNGRMEAISLKQQLSYATDETNSWKIYNENYDLILNNDLFTIDREGTDSNEQLIITGKRTGKQLMKLETTIFYNGQKFNYAHYFVIAVEVYNDEEAPIQITSAEEFENYLQNSELPADYILMNDIVLTNYTPLSTDLVNSLDGNGFVIHINSFEIPEEGEVNLALFNNVTENTTLKNVKVNIYNGGQIYINYRQHSSVNVAGFAINNQGTIYNCEVLSYYDESYQSSYIANETGLIVKFTDGNNSAPISLTSTMNVESKISGFVINNNASITNSRVGGESFTHIITIAGKNYIKTQNAPTFVLEGQGEVSGFVNTNDGSGNISACFVANIQIYNNMAAESSVTAGFVLYNQNSVQGSYVEGVATYKEDGTREENYDGSNITSIGRISGFVYENFSVVKNSYSNIAIENNRSKPSMATGFVYINHVDAQVTLCYTSCLITKTDINQMQFSGVDEEGNSLNDGEISFSYFYNESRIDDTNQNVVTTGALAVKDIDDIDTFYGFSFATKPDSYDGIWTIEDGRLTLVSANQIAFSNRFAVTNGTITSVFYNKSILDADTLRYVDLSYGGQNNPIIIRDAKDFALATGKASSKEISSYKEYYNDNEVFGNYRIVNNIDLLEIDQNNEEESLYKLTTTSKTFTGLLDGNGFTFSNLSLGSDLALENFGLFAKLDGAVIMNLNIIVQTVHDDRANIVGTLAGTAVDSKILAISLSPVSTTEEIGQTQIQGKNIVGGVVGMLFGESRMHDIKVKDIEIFSSYYDENKNIDDNKIYIGENLRLVVESGASIKSNVEKLSYAGAIAGYVDTYNLSVENETVQFMNSLEMSDYDIVTVYVTDKVDIYGEIAGGLFGYVGNSTMVYDAKLELDADMAETKPSHIISKNLFAGGLIGENYGGLFAVSAKYSAKIQTQIENNEYTYYNGSLTAEKGQQNIFAYREDDEARENKYNNPKYIGGLVGRMGGGYIYVGYNKLNVISYSYTLKNSGTAVQPEDNLNGEKDVVAVGGIIGLADGKDNPFQLTTARNKPEVNIYLKEVYSSGDLYAESQIDTKGISGGIIGALDSNSVVALQQALSLNYYSYDNSNASLLGNSHSVLIGKLNGDTVPDLYILDSDRGYLNVANGNVETSQGSKTVGGYFDLYASNNNFATLSAFGDTFNLDESTLALIDDTVLKAVHVGNIENSTMDLAYAKFYNYFMPLGWTEEYWIHNQGLFPDIVLMPKANIVFWDVDNTQRILEIMNLEDSSSMTVVVRGRKELGDGQIAYEDIDLVSFMKTEGGQDILENYLPIENFRGSLVSYQQYMNSSAEGLLTAENKYGGKIGDPVGIILNSTLFNNLNSAKIEGLTFYLCGNEEDNTGTYNFASGETRDVIFRELDFVLNNSFEITSSREIDQSTLSSGFITDYSVTTSFVDINIISKNGSSITFNIDSSNTNYTTAYVGVLAGFIEQISSFTPVSVEQLNFYVLDRENKETNDQFSIYYNSNFENLVAGLYAGKVDKGIGTNKALLTIGMAELNNVAMYFGYLEDENSQKNLTVGGYVGELRNIDSVSMYISENPDAKGVSINLNRDIKKLLAGLAFGLFESGSTLEISAPNNNENSILKGAVYQNNFVCEHVEIGGIFGRISSATEVEITKIGVNLQVSSKNGENSIYKFNDNLYDYKEFIRPFIINPTTEDADNAIGGFVGFAGTKLLVNGACEVNGIIDVQINQASLSEDSNVMLNIGGIVGKAGNEFDAQVSFENNLNISVKEQLDANAATPKANIITNVGGIIGCASSGIEGKIYINNASDTVSATINDIILSNVWNLNYGGAIGNVDQTGFRAEDTALVISNVIYGGVVKIYGESIGGKVENDKFMPGANITIGGIVGRFAPSETTLDDDATIYYTISKCISYGDVFVNYSNEFALYGKLASYNFGGIVGYASYLNVINCTSLMSSFNTRVTFGGDTKNSNVNAIVGAYSGKVVFDGNKYSSLVAMAYQEEEGNTDYAYGAEITSFEGYSTKVGNSTEANITTTGNILDGLGGDSYELGHKLNPYTINNNTLGGDILDADEIKGNYHNISWIAQTENLERSTVITDNLINKVYVGNGWILNYSDKNLHDIDTNNKNYGAVANTLGASVNKNNKSVNIGAITGLIVNNNVTADLNSNVAPKAKGLYGGVVGSMYENSTIYAVGVKGNLSVGGNQSLALGGIAGWVYGGKIDQCYVDADMSYRAAEGGNYSGIANFNGEDYASLLKNSYTSGLMETYVNVTLNALAYTNKTSATETADEYLTAIMDCYSVVQTKFNNVLSDNTEQLTIYLVNGYYASYESQVLNGVYGAIKYNNRSQTQNDEEININALPYYSNERFRTYSLNPDTQDTNSSAYAWYFHPFVNNGYASHGFGFLKNVTAFTREEVKDETTTEGNETSIKTYTYSPVSWSAILVSTYEDSWFLSVPNIEKFEQMIDTVDSTTDDQIGDNYDKAYKFVLRYDLELGDIFDKYTLNIGKEDKGFEFDGNNKTLSNITNPLFGQVTGNISNLRLTEVNVNGSGSLATSITGNLNNITAIGNLTASSSNAGGIVGTLKGDATAVDNVVNVTSTAEDATIGGIAGTMTSGNISYSSNAGQITGINASTAGGLVGLAQSSKITIKNSYNANSVLAGYTYDESTTLTNSYYAGGIIGKAAESFALDACYNTGLIGAGNYYNRGTAYAGGMFGNAAGATVTNCINDGSVEALSDMRDIAEGTKVTATKGNGVEETTAWSFSPGTLSYTITLKYPEDEVRRVYACGIGNGYTANENNTSNVSSSNNIKNDGWIKPDNQTQTLIFNRAEILDNNDGDIETIQGKFKASTDIYCNGYDSYGFPNRVYMKDTMVRLFVNNFMYGDNSSGLGSGLANRDIYKSGNNAEYAGVFKRGTNNDWQLAYSIAEGDGNDYSGNPDKLGNGKNAFLTDIFNSETKGVKAPQALGGISVNYWDVLYRFAAATDYYSYVRFATYESILYNMNEDSVQVESKDDNDIDIKIAAIDKAKEDKTTELTTITVNGETIAIVKNTTNLQTILTPYSTSVEDLKFTIDDENAEFDAISASDINWSVTYGEISYTPANVMISSMEKNENEKTITVSATLYFADSALKNKNVNINATLNYSGRVEKTLQRNSVVVINGQTTITLYEIESDILNGATLDSVKINGATCDGNFELIVPNEGYAQLKYDGILACDDGDALTIEYKTAERSNQPAELELDNENSNNDASSGSITVTKIEENQLKVTFKAYTYSFPNANWQMVGGGTDDMPISYQLDLTTLDQESTYDRVLIVEQNGNFGVLIEDETYTVTAGEESDVSVTDEGLLTISEDMYNNSITDNLYIFVDNYTNLTGEFDFEEQVINQDGVTVKQTINLADGNFSWDATEKQMQYNGTDIRNETDATQGIIEIAGVEFDTYTYAFDLKTTITVSQPLEIKTYDASDNVLDLIYHSGETEILIDNDATKISYNKVITSINQEKANQVTELENLEFKMNTESGLNFTLSTTSDEAEQYSISKESNSISTTKEINNDEVYSFTINNDGTIEVIYYFYNDNNELSSDTVKFDYNLQQKELKKYNYNTNSVDNYWTEDSTGFTYAYLEGYNNITIDTIVGDLVQAVKDDSGVITKESEIVYLKKPDKIFTVDVTGTMEYTSELEVTTNLIKGKQSYIDDSDFKGENNVQYSVDGGELKSWDDNNKYAILADYGSHEYVVTYDCSISQTIENKTISGTGIEDDIIILLGDDIYLGNNTLGENDKTIIGNGYAIRYNASSALFKTNSGQIKDLTVIAQVEPKLVLKDLLFPRTISTFAIENENTIENLTIYGGIRNLEANRLYSGNTLFASSSSTKVSGNSYLFVRGTDATLSKHVIAIINNYSNQNFISHNILIAGDGKDGSNGEDAVKPTLVGETGADGGTGGTIQNATTNDFARSGISGMGGYGGNGANGYFDGSKALGGGGGGKAGSNGANISLEDGANTSLKDRGRVDYKSGYVGNGGIGGLGRISSYDIMNSAFAIWTSGGGGAAGGGSDGNGKDGGKILPYKSYDTESGAIDLMRTIGHSYHYFDDDHGFGDYEMQWWKEDADEWIVNGRSADVANNVSAIDPAKSSSGIGGVGGTGGKSAGGTATAQYFFIRIEGACSSFGNWHIKENKYFKICWTSGEPINSGGAAGTTGDKI